MKKKILTLLLIGALMLTGCDKFGRIMDIILEKETEAAETDVPGSENPAASVKPDAQTPAKPETAEDASGFSEAALRDIADMKITVTEECSKNLGVMFLGTCEGTYADVMRYLKNMGGGMDTSYPWLMEMPEENFISSAGIELYAVVPGEDWIMTVYKYGYDPENDSLPARGEILYEEMSPYFCREISVILYRALKSFWRKTGIPFPTTRVSVWKPGCFRRVLTCMISHLMIG